MMPQALGGMVPGLGGMGMLGLMNLLGGGEDLMEDARDQNSDDLGADEYLTSSKARLEKYLQKQWQLGKRKLQVQVDFGNVPLEWEYLNQYHGVRLSSVNKLRVLGSSSNSVLLLCSNLKLQSSRVRRLFSNQQPPDRM